MVQDVFGFSVQDGGTWEQIRGAYPPGLRFSL